MAKRPKLNPATDTPMSRNDLSLEYMLQYVALNGTEEDKKWFIKLVEKNTTTKECTLPAAKGKQVPYTKQAAIRDAFCDRYFKQFAKEEENLTYLEKVKKLLK